MKKSPVMCLICHSVLHVGSLLLCGMAFAQGNRPNSNVKPAPNPQAIIYCNGIPMLRGEPLTPAQTKWLSKMSSLQVQSKELTNKGQFKEALAAIYQIQIDPKGQSYIDKQTYAIALHAAGSLQDAISMYRRLVYDCAPYDWQDSKGQSIRAQVSDPAQLKQTLEMLDHSLESEGKSSETPGDQEELYEAGRPRYYPRSPYILAQYILLLLQAGDNAEARMVYQWMIGEGGVEESWRTIFLQGAATARPKQIEALTVLFNTWKQQGRLNWASPASKYPALFADYIKTTKLKPSDWKIGMESMQFIADQVEQLYPNCLALPMTHADNIAFYASTSQEKQKAAKLYQSVLDRHGSSDALLAAKQIANDAMPGLKEDITSLQEEEEDEQAQAKTTP